MMATDDLSMGATMTYVTDLPSSMSAKYRSDLAAGATMFVPGQMALTIGAIFVVFTPGDRVKFVYNRAQCEGIITERVYDGANDLTFKVRVEFCNNWGLLGDDLELTVAASQMTWLGPGQTDDW